MAKLFAIIVVQRITSDAMQIHGAVGIMIESAFEIIGLETQWKGFFNR